MFGFLMMVVLLGVMGASVVAYRKSRDMERQQQLPSGYGGGAGGFQPAARQLTSSMADSGGRDVLNLRVNDLVEYFGTMYTVEGRLDYWEDGYTWVTYMLVDGDEIVWLSAEDDDKLEVSLWNEVEDLYLTEPIPEFVEYMGQRFRMTERGNARVNQQGRTGRKSGLNMQYFEYEGSGDEMLSVEKWGGDIEVSMGREIRPIELEIYPGDQVEY